MPISVTPVLSSVGYVSDVRDQAMSTLRFMIMNPGAISNLWDNELISFTEVASKYEQNRDALCSTISDNLLTILSRKFSNYVVNVNVDTEDVPGTAQYRVIFDVSMTKTGLPSETDYVPLIVSGKFLVDPKDYDISIEWAQSKDTASLFR